MTFTIAPIKRGEATTNPDCWQFSVRTDSNWLYVYTPRKRCSCNHHGVGISNFCNHPFFENGALILIRKRKHVRDDLGKFVDGRFEIPLDPVSE